MIKHIAQAYISRYTYKKKSDIEAFFTIPIQN